jgi:hypothetical protein
MQTHINGIRLLCQLRTVVYESRGIRYRFQSKKLAMLSLVGELAITVFTLLLGNVVNWKRIMELDKNEWILNAR